MTKFSVFTPLFLSLLLLLRGGRASREPQSARVSFLKRALFFFFLSSFEQRSVLLLLLFCSEERSATKQKQQREQNLDSSFLWQNTKIFLAPIFLQTCKKRREKISQKKEPHKKNTRFIEKRMTMCTSYASMMTRTTNEARC